ncbi:hypothetical protein V8G54_029341 [Vigna mungo]|uniref:Methylcrotonoyl-CoA carboxylase subunit alpha, mitochondrial n=1 Tax=Vigna mungo TaxID=3915 RepID=A0AAQ3MU24_VIGMU
MVASLGKDNPCQDKHTELIISCFMPTALKRGKLLKSKKPMMGFQTSRVKTSYCGKGSKGCSYYVVMKVILIFGGLRCVVVVQTHWQGFLDEFDGQAALSAAKPYAIASSSVQGFEVIGSLISADAGTVEFIVDTVSDEFYFMEMNTRLQVEHPVTEMIVGQDLVEWQILVANGEALPLSQSQAMLLKLESMLKMFKKGFFQQLEFYTIIMFQSHLKTGVKQGDTVSMHYDPMIAKLVVWGDNRASALVKLKDSLSKFQGGHGPDGSDKVFRNVAGLPTNVSFILKLANHGAFVDGNVETHFIDNYKEDLFGDGNNSVSDKEAYEAARHNASLVAACLIEKEHFISSRNPPGGGSLLPIWYSSPPFRVHHQAKRKMELEWENEYDSGSSKTMKLTITCQPAGRYLIETEENGSPVLDVKASYVKDCHFRVEAGGVINDVNVAVYSKDQTRHIHIWQGSHHHYFREKLGLDLSEDGELQHKPKVETSANPRGTVVAPMAGLVVKVLVENKTRVEEGQPVLVLEAMKMEHVVKAPSSGYVHELQVTVGEQVSDGSVLFRVKIISKADCGAWTGSIKSHTDYSFTFMSRFWQQGLYLNGYLHAGGQPNALNLIT